MYDNRESLNMMMKWIIVQGFLYIFKGWKLVTFIFYIPSSTHRLQSDTDKWCPLLVDKF